MTEDVHALVRLLQLASPALPIGAYSYSQGLEWAVEAGVVRDAAGAQAWIGDLLIHVQAEGEAAPIQSYDIPYRCFLPRHVARLLTAGRCISGTHRAHASYRVMNICMAMGDAVGTAAALAVSRGLRPHELPAGDVQQELLRKGVRLFD